MTQAPQNAPNGPKSRAAPADEPPEQTEDTTPPDWLTEDAHAAWTAAVALLTSVRIVAKSDLTALARYCQFLAEWIDLTAKIAANGHTLEDRFGQIKANPEVAARDSIEQRLRQLEKALGLDPSSYLDLTKDLAKAVTDKNKARNGKRVGGFLNTKKPDAK